MRNFIILTPTFNDWRSLNKLLIEIDKNISKIKGKFTMIVIDDASTIKPNLKLKGIKKIKKVIVITNKKNLGMQKRIYLGLQYIKKKIKTNNTTYIAGNGGSASIASHVSVDFIKVAKVKSSTFNNSNLITCFANDYGYENWVKEAIKSYCLKDSPQPHELFSLGLLNIKRDAILSVA